MMEREPCKQLPVLQPSALCRSAFLSSAPRGRLPQNSSSPGDRRVWVAAWQGCVHGNQSVCRGHKGGWCAGAGPNPLGGLLMIHGGSAAPALFRVYHGPSLTLLLPSPPTSSLSANPLGSTFKRYPKLSTSHHLLCFCCIQTRIISHLGACRSLRTGLPALPFL